MSETDLTISCGGLPAWSARGCKQTLIPIKKGELRRTVNGELAYTGHASHHKYRSVIKCRDKSAIAIDGLWQGGMITVGCIQRIGQTISGQSCTLDRQPVEGSLKCEDVDGKLIEIQQSDGRDVTLRETINNGYVTYRPVLQMRVLDFGYNVDEWDVRTGWYLALEEI